MFYLNVFLNSTFQIENGIKSCSKILYNERDSSLVPKGGPMSKYIRGNHKHLTLDDCIYIEKSLDANMSFKNIAIHLCKDPTTISKEIQKHRIEKQATNFISSNHCALVKDCKRVNVCKMTYRCGRLCKTCKSCNSKCLDFVPKRCKSNTRAPYVCNGCDKKRNCRLLKYYYKAASAHKEYRSDLVLSREGINLTQKDFQSLDSFISPLLMKGQPLAHIYATHENEIPVSRRTLYHYLDLNIMTARNLDLPRRVRYKPRRHHPKQVQVKHSWKENRTFDDFVSFLSLHPDTSVVEMDTVEGEKGGKVLLTFLFRQSHLMLAFLLKQKTQHEVIKVFNSLEDALGSELFRKTFPLLLTDNGSEFINPILIEIGVDSKVRTSLYYCDPRASYQKGALEKNHEFIRYFASQGTSFDSLTQEDVTKMINHINSTARDGLNGHNPFELASLLLDKFVINQLNLEAIHPDEVTLKPSLLFQSLTSKQLDDTK